jgi:membrane-associated phospholipid phosphatase
MAVTGRGRVRGAIVAFGAPALVAAATDRGRAASADRAGFRAVLARRCPAGITVARAVSALAEPGVVYPLLAAVGAARRDGWWGACVPCLVVASGAAARGRLSRMIARQRPPAEAWLSEPEGFSLPSKHTTLAALAAGACVRAVGGRGAAARSASVLAAAAVGASRVYLGVHWPADVLAGWLFAEGWLRVTASHRPRPG